MMGRRVRDRYLEGCERGIDEGVRKSAIGSDDTEKERYARIRPSRLWTINIVPRVLASNGLVVLARCTRSCGRDAFCLSH